MNKFEAWAITICILAVMLSIPSWVYRWMLIGFIGVPVAVAPKGVRRRRAAASNRLICLSAVRTLAGEQFSPIDVVGP